MAILTQPWPLRNDRRSWGLAAAILVVLVVAVALVDTAISLYGQSLPEPVIGVFRFITRFGESDYILIPSLILWLVSAALAAVIPRLSARLALRQMSGIWAFIFIGVGLPSLVTTIIKRLVGRARPEVEGTGAFDFQAFPWTDWQYQSFPSGHATTALAACFVLSFLAPRWYPALLVLAVLICLSRIVLGAHYPTDLLVGAVIGTLGAYLVRNAFARRGWVFRIAPDGTTAVRALSGVRRLIRSF